MARVLSSQLADLASPLLDHVSHRPWPLPSRPWAGHMRWVDLAFLHWRVDPEMVRPLIPPDLTLETYDDAAWVGVVPFRMEDVRLRFTPAIPGTSAFPELNVRTYVRVGERFGVWFFSLDAANRLAVRGARFLYDDAEMLVRTEGERIVYESRRVHTGAPPAEFVASYAPTGPAYHAEPGTLDYFLVERYCLFMQSRRGTLGYLDVHHLPWTLQQAEARIAVNTMGTAAGLALPPEAPRVHFAREREVLAWNGATI
jgi:uncharacterized protein YqjF (DUF2071 family)